MSGEEKGEWKLVKADGCENGSLAALYQSHREGWGQRILGIRLDYTRVHWENGVLVWEHDTSPVHVAELVKNRFEVLHPVRVPLTRALVARVIAAAMNGCISPRLADEIAGRTLPEFPRRIKFSERLPPDGALVIFESGGLPRVGAFERAKKLGPDEMLSTEGSSVDVSTCDWWHPIAGPDDAG